MSATLSIGDATAVEGDANYRYIDDFVSSESGGLSGPRHITFGPDGHLYVTSRFTNEVLRYDGDTGAPLGAFVAAGSGGLDAPWAITFGPDGSGDGIADLYVGSGLSQTPGSVLRYDGTSGAFLDAFVSAGSGDLTTVRGLTFGPEGDLYASAGTGVDASTRRVNRYDRTTGAFLDTFVEPFSGGADALQGVQSLAFGPDGNLYVADAGGDKINRYDGSSGEFLDVFVPSGSGGLDLPHFLAFHSDGMLYVSSQSTEQVLRYDASTGTFVDVVVPDVAGELPTSVNGLAFDADDNLYVAVGVSGEESRVVRYGFASQAAFTVSLSAASATPVTVDFTVADGTAFSGSDYTAASGTLTFAPGETSRTVLVQTLDDSIGEPTEMFTVTLLNAVAATIADGTGVGTILDNETKFYVVNDASTNQTFEYGSGGAAGEVYTLNSGNSAPRGAASTAAGDKVWVVDANKKVYIYNTSGGLLGSWTAGSLASNAQVEGITTNGTDVWIVDARQDRVFRYTGAASRLSGSQNAASSFNLNGANSNPKDLVTDGTSIWVVNDSTTDKVFKYNLSGTLLGSWTIDAANFQPTGITLDPTNVNALWIVDAGADKVFQYSNAASRTSGSQNADATFLLAAGNTNPQGIADPPAAGDLLAATPASAGQATAVLDRFFADHGPASRVDFLSADILSVLLSLESKR